MTVDAFIIGPGEWFMYERRSVVITITGTPADVAGRFVLRKQAGSPVLLEKTGSNVVVSGDDDEIVTVAVGGSTYEHLMADYLNLYAGVFWGELYDLDTPLLSARGDVHIGHGDPPEEA